MPTKKKTPPQDVYDKLKKSFCDLLDLDFSEDDSKERAVEELMGDLVEIVKKELLEELSEALTKLAS